MPPDARLADAPRPDRLLTANQVADLLALPVSWVREQTRNNSIPHLKLGRYRRYQQSAIQAWLREQHAGPSPAIPAAQRPDLPSRPDQSL
jgi:excisionase family DNA binding protein